VLKRAALAAALLVAALLTGGCGDTVQGGAAGPPRLLTPTAGPSPTAGPARPATPGPTRTPTRKTTGGLPAGLQRTTGTRHVALTFDDGPHPDWTPRVLDQLKAAGVKATFCVVGVKVKSHPALVARIVREGHTLCNHSWQHDLKLGRKSAAVIRADLARTNQEIAKAAPGAPVHYYRQPGGMWTARVVSVARALKMKPLHWDVDPQDWAKPTAAQISSRVVKHARPGSIVLLHDGGGDRSRTLAACPGIIRTLNKKYGITLLT
jgi:peptidoglycan/xylan/chitin deacetylase (PgdA/CDA1 family)